MNNYQSVLTKSYEHFVRGEVLLFPTDTIWGIGGDATNIETIEKVYNIKQRPLEKSFIILVDGLKMLKQYVSEFPPLALKYINSKNSITVVYEKSKNLPSSLLSVNNSIAIRVVRKEFFCYDLIKKTNKPLIATSANMSGVENPKILSEVDIFIKNQVDYIVNLPIDLSKNKPSRIVKISEAGEEIVLRE